MELFELGTVPEIFADGIANVLFVGEHTRFMLFAWKSVGGILRRCLVGEVIRPTTSLPPGMPAYFRQRFPQEESVAVH